MAKLSVQSGKTRIDVEADDDKTLAGFLALAVYDAMLAPRKYLKLPVRFSVNEPDDSLGFDEVKLETAAAKRDFLAEWDQGLASAQKLRIISVDGKETILNVLAVPVRCSAMGDLEPVDYGGFAEPSDNQFFKEVE